MDCAERAIEGEDDIELEEPSLPQDPHTGFDVEAQIRIATILTVAFVSEHNLSFACVDHLCDLYKRIFPDSKVAQGLNMKRTKATAVAHKMSSAISGDLASRLRVNKFSIIIDETTDSSKTKCLAIVVKYYDMLDSFVRTKLLSLLNVYDENNNGLGESAEALYENMLQILRYFHIPLENCIGFAADTTNVMFGSANSVVSRLQENFPGIVILKCVCHSLHLCSSKACKQLPRQCEDLVRNVYSHFSHSAKKRFSLKHFQGFFEEEPLNILHPSQTRWLSLYQSVKRILQQKDALIVYFVEIEPIEKLATVTQILKNLKDPWIHAYLTFLNFILPKIVSLNVLFQKETPTIYKLHYEMSTTYRTFLQYFCKKDKIDKSSLGGFNPALVSNHLLTEQIYVGAELLALFQKPEYNNNTSLNILKNKCKDFYIELCMEMRARFNFDDPMLSLITIIDPENVMKARTRVQMPSLVPLISKLPRIYNEDPQIIDDEWRALDAHIIPDEFKLNNCGVVRFYQRLETLKVEGVPIFKTFTTFCLQVLSLPISNADAERYFSKTKLIKPNIRNSLSVESLQALIQISDDVRDNEACYLYEPSEAVKNCIK